MEWQAGRALFSFMQTEKTKMRQGLALGIKFVLSTARVSGGLGPTSSATG